jgi:microcystin-dependent protein
VADNFVGEIRAVGFNFAPQGWAFCNGQLLSIAQNTALFSLLGTFYGGDGRSTFALPNLQGMVPINQGNGAGLSPRVIGESGGERTVTLLQTQMPAHRHTAGATTQPGDQLSPAGMVPATPAISRGARAYATGDANTSLSPSALSVTGGGQPHNNMAPFLVLNFVIALQGIFPARS